MNQTDPTGDERRRIPRYAASATARVLRESDVMQFGIEAELKDVSVIGLGLIVSERLDRNEEIKIQLSNHIQRISKEVRGVVRHVTCSDDKTYHVGVELLVRLTPLEVSLLRMGMQHDAEEGGTRWV